MRNYLIKTAALYLLYTKYEKVFELYNKKLSDKVKTLILYEKDISLMMVVTEVLTDSIGIANNKFDMLLLSARERKLIIQDPIEWLVQQVRNLEKKNKTVLDMSSIGKKVQSSKNIHKRIITLKNVLSESIQIHILSDYIR